MIAAQLTLELDPTHSALCRVHAPYGHPVLGEVWVNKKTSTHISFYAQTGERVFSKFRWSRSEFDQGREAAQ